MALHSNSSAHPTLNELLPSLLPPSGTFGEAFKAGGVVLKIVPMQGSVLVNGEPQKRADEILAEVSVTLTLSCLNGAAAAPGACRAAEGGWLGDGKVLGEVGVGAGSRQRLSHAGCVALLETCC